MRTTTVVDRVAIFSSVCRMLSSSRVPRRFLVRASDLQAEQWRSSFGNLIDLPTEAVKPVRVQDSTRPNPIAGMKLRRCLKRFQKFDQIALLGWSKLDVEDRFIVIDYGGVILEAPIVVKPAFFPHE
jgi:hypothetical protein